MLRQKIYGGVMLAMVMAVLSACGVKSTPKQVEGSTFGQIYPAPEPITVKPASTSNKADPYAGGYVRNNRVDKSGYYTPPAPATETLVK